MNITKSELHELIMECMEECMEDDTYMETMTWLHTPFGKGFFSRMNQRGRRDHIVKKDSKKLDKIINKVKDCIDSFNDLAEDEEFLGFTEKELDLIRKDLDKLRDLVDDLSTAKRKIQAKKFNYK